MHCKKTKLLAVLLTASLLFQSAGITVKAETDSPVIPPEETFIQETVGDIPEESSTAGGSETGTLDGEDVENSSFPGLPNGYIFSADQLEEKAILSEHTDDFAIYTEEDNTSLYVKGELVFLADSEEEAQMVAEAFGGELLRYEWGVAVIRLSEDRTVAQACIAAADSSTLLPAVWPNYYKELYVDHNDPALSDLNDDFQWQHEFVGDTYAWAAGHKGQGVKVGILDTGILKSHEEFKGRIANSAGDDVQGHGTHVAGIVAANLDNGVGGAGIAPEASLYIYAIGDSGGSITLYKELTAINQAISDKLDVINMSFGSSFFSEPENAVLQSAYKSGIALFAAAGNDGASAMNYPASYNNVCSVASLQQDGRKSYFSNFNSSVDLAFPGSDIYSTSRNGENSYEYKDGTSMACPVAVGTAAVILSGADSLPALKGTTGSKRVDALYKIMKQNTNRCSSKGTGSGTTYLPKVFDLNTASSVPAAPTFSETNKKTFSTETTSLQIKGGSYGIEIYYSTNGKTPTYKDGDVKNGTLYTSAITIGNAKSVTVKAIAVNTMIGKASKVASATYTFAPTPTNVEITAANGVNKLVPGSKLSLKASVTPSYSVATKVKWAVAPAGAGVTINASGKLSVAKTASPGAYIVTATAADKKGNEYKTATKSMTINVISAATGIKTVVLAKKSETLPVGNTLNLATDMTITKGDGTPGDAKDIVWSSSNPKVAKVENGIVTAITPGKVDIKATANDGSNKGATCKLTVTQQATNLSITGPSKLAAGKSITLKATLTPNNVSSKQLDWKVEGSDVTIKNGKLTARKTASGACTVTATTKDGSNVVGTHKVTIVSEPIKSIKLDKSITLFNSTGAYNAPTTVTLKPEITGGDSTAIAYTSSAPSIASVDKKGIVHALKCGKAKITCQATDGSKKKAVCTVTVSAPMSRVTVISTDDSNGIVCVGSSIKLGTVAGTSFGTPASTKVDWSVAKGYEDLISVNDKGVVTAKALGNVASSTNYNVAYVTATAADGSNAASTYSVFVHRKVKKIELVRYANNEDGAPFSIETTLDNDHVITGTKEDPFILPYTVNISVSGKYKAGITKTAHIFFVRADKATTTKPSSSLFLTTADGTKCTVKVTLPSCKKSASMSGYLVQFANGYAGFYK